MYSTFYKARNQAKVYTTKSRTQHHQHLCNMFKGKTYKHSENDCLYFMEGMPLDKPINGVLVS